MKRKWLLDHNLPTQLAKFLKSAGIDCSWTSAEGWQNLSNGELVKAAVASGYTCLLTNDRQFANSAGNALTKNPGFSVVEIELLQAPKHEFIKKFETAWNQKNITPEPAKVIKWPN